MEARIGIIGGNGWLGNAIAWAAVAAGAVDPARMTLSGRSDNRGATEIPGARWTKDNGELVDRSDVVVLSVRPDQFPGVRIAAQGKLVVSVMAGVTARAIAERTGATEVIRAIPNAAAVIRRSFTPWYATPPVSSDNKQLVQELFKACGDAAEVPLEAHIDYCVGMTGSGAAFPALRPFEGHAVGEAARQQVHGGRAVVVVVALGLAGHGDVHGVVEVVVPLPVVEARHGRGRHQRDPRVHHHAGARIPLAYFLHS